MSISTDTHLASKLEALRGLLREMAPIVVGFSGGVDSGFLAAFAAETLGSANVTAVTARSPSLPDAELAECRSLAAEWGLLWSSVETHEIDRPEYRTNDENRCYHCKVELMLVVTPIAQATSSTVTLGVNVDDLGDHRPGQSAAVEAGARFPLLEAGLDKGDIREAARQMGLAIWDKPAAACLASRVPYGTEVTVGILTRVERAEAALHALGFRQCRVRHYGDTARVEVELDALSAVIGRRADVVAAVRNAGYEYVTLDLEGFRSGNLNSSLT